MRLPLLPLRKLPAPARADADLPEAVPTLAPLSAALPPAALEPREILLHRCVVRISPDRIEVRRPHSLVVLPAIGVGLTGFLLFALVQWAADLPFWVLPLLLIGAVVALPLSGLGLVYAVFGANVVADRAGQSVAWKQGFLGMGVGTVDLVPFWKIREFVVEDVGRALRYPDREEPAHAFAQWELALVKKSGKRLRIGSYSVPRSLEEAGLDRVMEVAEAFAVISGAPLQGPIW